MFKHVTLSGIVLFGLLTAACTSTPQASFESTSASASAVGTTAAPGPEALNTPQPDAAPTQGELVPPSLAPNRCPPITANPVGCPGPLPPLPLTPQTGQARILFCSQPVVAGAPPITVGAIVCGAGFHAEELVTITVTGRMGSTSWEATARSDGTFRSVLSPAACRVMPAYVIARGNHGSVSNALPIGYAVCRRTP